MISKSFGASRVKVKNESTGEVEAVFATLGVVDKDGDVIMPGAIKNGSTVAISAYGHSVWKGDAPAGAGTIHEIGSELVLKGRYFLDTDQGRNDFNTVKGLAEFEQGEWSFGLLDVVSQRTTKDGITANFISSVDVPEVSPVFMGAGVNTRTTGVKGTKQLASSLRRLLSNAGRSRWESGGTWVWLEDYDPDQGYAVFGIDSREGDRLTQVDFTYTDTSVELGAEETEVHQTRVFLPKSHDGRFSEHADAVMADVSGLIDRAEEVVTLRAAKGKTIGDESLTVLTAITGHMDRLKTLIDTPTDTPTTDTNPDDIADQAQAEFLKFVATSQGVTQ